MMRQGLDLTLENTEETMDEGDSGLTEEKISADLNKKADIFEAAEPNGSNEPVKEKTGFNLVGFKTILR
jgi:hypothetical protein